MGSIVAAFIAGTLTGYIIARRRSARLIADITARLRQHVEGRRDV